MGLIKLERDPSLSAVELIELSTVLSKSADFGEGFLPGPEFTKQQIQSRKNRDCKLNIWGVSALVLGTVGLAGIPIHFEEEFSYFGLPQTVHVLICLGAVASVSQFFKYRSKAIPGLREQDILNSPSPDKLRSALKILSELRAQECQLYICSGPDLYYKLPEKFLTDSKYTLLLLGNKQLRAQITSNKTLINGKLFVKRADVKEFITKPAKGTGQHSRFSPYFIAFYMNEHIRNHYLKNAKNWHDETHSNFKLKLSRKDHRAYHKTLIYIAEHYDEFKEWVDGHLKGKENIDYLIKTEKLLGLREDNDDSTPTDNETTAGFQKLEHRSINTYLKNRDFIDESKLPSKADYHKLLRKPDE